MTPKTNLRASFERLRASIPEFRQKEASKSICNEIKKSSAHFILSFDSFRSEIDLSELNQCLSKEKRLVLTKIEKTGLELYLVEDLAHQTELSPLGFKEPIPSQCQRIAPVSIDLALIPGLAFDDKNYRLGYGKGYYDRLLEQKIPSIGVGFLEQKHSHLLPRDPWDIPVGRLFLA